MFLFTYQTIFYFGETKIDFLDLENMLHTKICTKNMKNSNTLGVHM